MNESLGPSRSRLLNVAFMVGIAGWILLLSPAISVFWPRVDAANYQKINDQISFHEVERLLGTPSYDSRELRLVKDPGTYVTNDILPIPKKLAMGYRDYRRVQWSSRQFTIILIFDSNGMVPTGYRFDGQSSGLLR